MPRIGWIPGNSIEIRSAAFAASVTLNGVPAQSDDKVRVSRGSQDTAAIQLEGELCMIYVRTALIIHCVRSIPRRPINQAHVAPLPSYESFNMYVL